LSSGRPKLKIAYAIATTGFFGMLVNLILIFSFQVFYGYLYYHLGLLISIFMTGIAGGSILMTTRIKRIRNALGLFSKLELSIILFTCILWVAIYGLTTKLHAYLFFLVLFFVSGFLMGIEFPLASHIYLGKKQEIGSTTGVLYALDLFGGWLAGILGGTVFLPILGLFNICLVIVMLKLSSFLVLKRP
ncbi:MAG: spermine synthase, partial [Candidatus Omnitrophica bacterium]|nr:spermine synthase [Candidatus Omnitrophota bacterium]